MKKETIKHAAAVPFFAAKNWEKLTDVQRAKLAKYRAALAAKIDADDEKRDERDKAVKSIMRRFLIRAYRPYGSTADTFTAGEWMTYNDIITALKIENIRACKLFAAKLTGGVADTQEGVLFGVAAFIPAVKIGNDWMTLADWVRARKFVSDKFNAAIAPRKRDSAARHFAEIVAALESAKVKILDNDVSCYFDGIITKKAKRAASGKKGEIKELTTAANVLSRSVNAYDRALARDYRERAAALERDVEKVEKIIKAA